MRKRIMGLWNGFLCGYILGEMTITMMNDITIAAASHKRHIQMNARNWEEVAFVHSPSHTTQRVSNVPTTCQIVIFFIGILTLKNGKGKFRGARAWP